MEENYVLWLVAVAVVCFHDSDFFLNRLRSSSRSFQLKSLLQKLQLKNLLQKLKNLLQKLKSTAGEVTSEFEGQSIVVT
ncbi:MAG: hypothetical protein U5N58_07170 [Actinomycetota bacterium]|nr:hypothetical protein [Actinomycetota bacterium]